MSCVVLFLSAGAASAPLAAPLPPFSLGCLFFRGRPRWASIQDRNLPANILEGRTSGRLAERLAVTGTRLSGPPDGHHLPQWHPAPRQLGAPSNSVPRSGRPHLKQQQQRERETMGCRSFGGTLRCAYTTTPSAQRVLTARRL